jgi:SRSO17 transposase
VSSTCLVIGWKIMLAVKRLALSSSVRFQTKCELARRMLERLQQAQVSIDWVVADTDLRK